MTATPAIAVRLRRESAMAPVTQLSGRPLVRGSQGELPGSHAFQACCASRCKTDAQHPAFQMRARMGVLARHPSANTPEVLAELHRASPYAPDGSEFMSRSVRIATPAMI